MSKSLGDRRQEARGKRQEANGGGSVLLSRNRHRIVCGEAAILKTLSLFQTVEIAIEIRSEVTSVFDAHPALLALYARLAADGTCVDPSLCRSGYTLEPRASEREQRTPESPDRAEALEHVRHV